MANITNPQAIKFCNEQIRVAADLFETLYRTAVQLTANWNAIGGVALIPNDISPIIDGATTDGRKPITGAMVSNIIARSAEFAADQEASGNAKINTVRQVSTNGQPRF